MMTSNFYYNLLELILPYTVIYIKTQGTNDLKKSVIYKYIGLGDGMGTLKCHGHAEVRWSILRVMASLKSADFLNS